MGRQKGHFLSNLKILLMLANALKRSNFRVSVQFYETCSELPSDKSLAIPGAFRTRGPRFQSRSRNILEACTRKLYFLCNQEKTNYEISHKIPFIFKILIIQKNRGKRSLSLSFFMCSNNSQSWFLCELETQKK